MILLVDVGNSRIKWGTLDAGKYSPGRSARWSANRLEALLDVQWGGLPRPAAVWVASVAGPAAARIMNQWCERRFGSMPRYATSSAELAGVTNAYAEPSTLGVDRLLAMAAARRRYSEAVCVVDCGTAVTVDLLDGRGVFRGGVIAPGSGLMRRALSRATHALPPSRVTASSVCALSTVDGIAAGCLFAVVAFIERIYREFSEVLGGAPACVVTGGEAPLILPRATLKCDHDPDLVLRGLACVAESSKG